MPKAVQNEERFVLLVSPDEADHPDLRAVLHPPAWTILQVHNPTEARLVLHNRPVDAVIADSQCWKSLLAEMWALKFPFIVAARLADERLWAEVLNLGAYDLVSKPFEAKVVLHVFSSAWRHKTGVPESLTLKLHGCAEGQPADMVESAALAHP